MVSPDPAFWRGRRVFLTGHTGFKGGWLALWLHRLGARVTGYALPPDTQPSLFELAGVAQCTDSVFGDVRDAAQLAKALRACAPEVVLHLAAQPLVRRSYRDPVETYATNVMGTVHLLEAVRACPSVRAAVVVTSDKCYENREWPWGYRETDPMGGFDPYSNSKGCAELVSAAYRNSFLAQAGTALATARAGNVIGGGDWAEDRLVPDLLAAFASGRPAPIRRPNAVRPWQHVLEPLSGYLALAERLAGDDAARFAEAWNFGPHEADAQPVGRIATRLAKLWGEGAAWTTDGQDHPHEATWLKLDCSKARQQLGWTPRWNLDRALHATVRWQLGWARGEDPRALAEAQIAEYESTPTHG